MENLYILCKDEKVIHVYSNDHSFMHVDVNIMGYVHKWVDQFAIDPNSLFTQNNDQKLEIITSLH
jgi:hypothetical protein